MDPNETLRKCRDALIEYALHNKPAGIDCLEELAEHFLDLDDWLTNKRGALPTDWAQEKGK